MTTPDPHAQPRYRIRQAGIPDAHAQVWVLVEELGDRLRLRRIEDAPTETCILPRDWLEPLPPPIPDEPEPGAYQIGGQLFARAGWDRQSDSWRYLGDAPGNWGDCDLTWAEVWEHLSGDRTIQRLVPEAPLAVAKLLDVLDQLEGPEDHPSKWPLEIDHGVTKVTLRTARPDDLGRGCDAPVAALVAAQGTSLAIRVALSEGDLWELAKSAAQFVKGRVVDR